MYNLPVDIDVQMIQKNKLFQKFIQQQQDVQQKPIQQPKQYVKSNHDSMEDQKYSHDKMEESSIYQDFANFAKATTQKQASPFNYAKQQNQTQQQQMILNPQINNNSQELKELQLKNKSLIQQNSILQQQLLELQQTYHRYTVDLDIQKNEILNQKRVIQEQQIEIELLKRQLQEKRNSSLDKTRQFTIVQTQLIQSNQMVEKLISQLMNQEQQLSLYRQTQMNFPKIDGMSFNVEQNKSNLINASNLLSNPSQMYGPPTQQIPMQQIPIQQNPIQQQQQQLPNPVSQPTKQQQIDADTSYERYLMHKRGRQ